MSLALRHLAIITGNYPSPLHPYDGMFVRQLVYGFAELGVRCTVIHPWKLHDWMRERGKEPACGTQADDRVQILHPLTLSLSNRRLGPFNTFAITYANFRRAAWRALKSMNRKPDAVYGHFMYPAGATAVWAGQRLGRPGFVAVGEGNFWTLRPLGVKRARRDLTPMAGAIAVSGLLRRRLIEELALPPDKVAVFPNGVDLRKFHPRDRSAMRRKHGLPEDRFLVIYVGDFIEPKGVRRVAEAIDGLQGVAGIFVGSGPLAPRIPNLAFCGRVSHEQVPEMLSAADCFVLPSDVEGSSNATLEAMACGLPVVVSARPFNEDICDKDTAWLVEPEDVAAIREAIVALQNNPDLRRRLADAAFSRAARFDIQARAQRILEWMTQKTDPHPQTTLPKRAEANAAIST